MSSERQASLLVQGIRLIETIMPFPLKSSNGYLAEGDDGWVVIDGGVNTENNRQQWERALQEIGISFSQIRRIYVTHYHHDHLGLAGWLQRQTNAPVYMSSTDVNTVQRVIRTCEDTGHGYPEEIEKNCRRHGWSSDLVQQLADDVDAIAPLITPLPEFTPIEPGHQFQMGGQMFTAQQVPGHSDGHLVFLGDQGHLFAGDNLLATYHLHVTDWPYTRLDNPLNLFLEAMENLDQGQVATVYPGHGPVFHDFTRRLAELRQHHYQRITAVLSGLARPLNPWELAQIVYPPAQYIHIKRLALAETLTYLQYLEARGLVISTQEDTVRYHIRSDAPPRETALAELISKC